MATGDTPAAKGQGASAEDVEAAYLYNFGKFVRWPESGGHEPLLICIAGQDSFGQDVTRLVSGEQINGHSLEARMLRRGETAQGCSILFVSATERARLERLLAETEGRPMLTVSDAPDFLARGGIIQFVLVEDHVRFSVNLDAAARHGLVLSSELLKVAVSVTGRPGQGGSL